LSSTRIALQINWTGLIVFAGFCVALWAAVSRPTWMPLAEGVATILILLVLADSSCRESNRTTSVQTAGRNQNVRARSENVNVRLKSD
jgi:hypothetical protein